MISARSFIERLPKAELHLHLEGTLEPEQMFAFARRHRLPLRYRSTEQLRAAYRFQKLQDFLDLYYEGTSVLREEEDFYELTAAYLEKASKQGVLHAEMFFDPQAHTRRGIAFEAVIGGISRAADDARLRLGISTRLILCFLRDLSATSAMETLEQALDHKDRITAVGLDSTEVGHPPKKFEDVFARARAEGFRAVAHAGEEGPAQYVQSALDDLGAERIDHGNRALEDPALVARLARSKTPLTVCPLSNIRLGVVDRIEAHPLRRMLELGLSASVHSDDPAYFGGYVNENYITVARALGLGESDIVELAKNSFRAAFVGDAERDAMLGKLERYVKEHVGEA